MSQPFRSCGRQHALQRAKLYTCTNQQVVSGTLGPEITNHNNSPRSFLFERARQKPLRPRHPSRARSSPTAHAATPLLLPVLARVRARALAMAEVVTAWLQRGYDSIVGTVQRGLDAVSDSPLFSRKRRRDPDTPAPPLPPPPQQSLPPPLPRTPPDARAAFAAEAAGRTNALPTVLRGEPALKRARASPAWSNATPGIFSALRTPALPRTTNRRLSLPPRTLRLSTDSTLAGTPIAPAALLAAAGATPRIPVARRVQAHRPPPAPRDSALARQRRKSLSDGYLRNHALRRRKTPMATSRPALGRIMKPVRARPAPLAVVAAARKEIKRSDTLGWPSPICTNLAKAIARRRDLPTPVPTPMPFVSKRPRSRNAMPTSALTAPANAVQPPTVPRIDLSAVRTPRQPQKLFSARALSGGRQEVSEQRQSEVDSNVKRTKIPDRLDVAKLVGISREELCKLYTPGVVEMMEINPILAEKLLKKHSSDMASHLRHPARRSERQKRIVAAEAELAKIRSHSRLYHVVEKHSNDVHSSVLNATEAAGGNCNPRAESPPDDDAPHWNLHYWVEEEGYEEDPESLAEKQESVSVIDESSAFSPLTPSALKRVRHVLGSQSVRNEQFVNIGGCRIHGSDLQLLKPNTWLNDEIVNSYMELIFRRAEKSNMEAETSGEKALPKIRCLSSFFYAKLFEKSRAQGCHVYDYTRVRRWTRKFDIFAHDMVLVPINQHNMHWTLAVINLKLKRVEHYDSFGGGGSHDILKNLMQWVVDEMENKKQQAMDTSDWELIPMTSKLPQQDNSDDCGVFVCKFADFISRGAEITFRASHMRYFRSRIAHELLMQRVA